MSLTHELPTPGERKAQIWASVRRVLTAGLGGACLVTALGVGGHHLATSDTWEIQSIQVTGNQRASTVALRHLANLQRGEHFLTVDLHAAVRGVESHPWVRSAEARRAFPGVIELVITEHEPVMLLALDGFWYVDADGQPFKRAMSDDLNYPVLTGVDPELAASRPELAAAIVHGALRVLHATAEKPELGAANTSEIHFEARTGYTLVLLNGTELVLGMGNPGAPLERLGRLTAAGLNLTMPQRIDLDAEAVAIATPLHDVKLPPPSTMVGPEPAMGLLTAPAPEPGVEPVPTVQ